MKEGLELLYPLKNIPKKLEDLFNLDFFPESYEWFLKTYQVGEKSIKREYIEIYNDSTYKLTGNQYSKTIDSQIYTNSIDYFFDYNQLLLEISNFKQKLEIWHKRGFIQIGLLEIEDILLLGVDSSVNNQIWRYGQWMFKENFLKLEDDIFSFINLTKEIMLTSDLEDYNIKTNELYRNWSENFWRVKKN